MPIPAIIGGGEKLKKKADLGLLPCTVCGHETLWTLHDAHTQFTIFFLPAFTWDHYDVAMCERCGNKVKVEEK